MLQLDQQFLLIALGRGQARHPRRIHEDVAGGAGAQAAADRGDAVIELPERLHELQTELALHLGEPEAARAAAARASEVGEALERDDLQVVGLALDGLALVHEGEAADGMPELRTSTMTHIVWCPPAWRSQARATLAGLLERHPARTIFLIPAKR